MERRFYITGLPRSRTAWLSRLFSHGESYCLHDPTPRGDWLSKVDTMPHRAVGVSDSGLSMLSNIPTGKWLVIRRDPADSLHSFLSMPQYPGIGKLPLGATAAVYLRMMEGLERIHQEEDSMSLKYDELDDESAIRAAWDFLIGDIVPWSDFHWEEMRHLKIVVRPETYGVIQWPLGS